MSEDTPHDRDILQARCGDGEELPEQIHQAVQLQDHPGHGPPAQHQRHPAEEGDDAAETVLAGEEAQGAGGADSEGQAREEEDVAQGQQRRVKEEEDAKEEECEAQEHEACPYFGVVGYHVRFVVCSFCFCWGLMLLFYLSPKTHSKISGLPHWAGGCPSGFIAWLPRRAF